jgi:hypothetical protein
MGFNIKPNFNIYIDDEVFFQNNSNFEEILSNFFESPIYEDILDLNLDINREDTKFFKQFNFYAEIVRAKMARNLLSPINKNTDGWRDVVLVASLYNPFENFVMMQLAFYISKIQPKSVITFVVGYEDIYKNTITLIDGTITEITSIIFDYETYSKFMETDNLTITSEELGYIFKKLKEKAN